MANTVSEDEARQGSGRKLVLVLVALILVVGLGWLARYLTYGRYFEGTNDAYLKADMVDIAPKLPGYVEAVLVTDNQAVSAGTPLVRISTTDSGATLAQLDAQLAEAHAAVGAAEGQLLGQDAAIRTARAEAADARARLAFARAQVARYAPLARSGAETEETLDQIRQAQTSAEAALEAAAARARAAEHQRAALDAQQSGARARVKAIIAQQRRAHTDVALAVLRSNIGGRIGDRTVRVGQYVQIGQRLMTVVPVRDVYVIANFKETQLRHMRIGQPVRIAVDALDGEALHGTVESFSPGTGSEFALLPPQNATGNFTKIVQRVPVRIKISDAFDAKRLIVPGMSVVASVDTRNVDR